VVMVPPEGVLEYRWDSRKMLCFIHVTVKIVSGLPYTSHDLHTLPPPHKKHGCVEAAPRGSGQE